MSAPQRIVRGQGTLQFGQHSLEVPVAYAISLTWEAGGDGTERLSVSGHLHALGTDWPGVFALRHARVLVLDDGCRLLLWLCDAGPAATSLSFMARPVDGIDFPAG